MRTIIISDTHLTHEFQAQKYAFLYRLISSADRVVLNGDIWDSFHTDWKKFSQSSWRHLFPLLRSKQAIYIFGNHDPQSLTKEPWLLATDWGNETEISIAGKILHIEHGHRFGLTFDLQHPWLARIFRDVVPYRLWTFRDIEWNRRTDRAMRLVAQTEFSDTKLLVVGHSHLPGFSLSEHYLNSGFIYNGRAHWIELGNEKISLKHAPY